MRGPLADEAASPDPRSLRLQPDGARTGASPETDAEARAAAFERLTMPYLRDVTRFAHSLTRDAVRGADLVQETYLQALRGWHTYQADGDPRRWLFTICRHAFLRTVRRDARYVDAPEDDPELESLATAVAHDDALRTGVAAAMERLDLGPAIARALTELPPYYRLAVVLVDVEDQSYEDAALVLGVPVGTVRSRLFRGRRLLQDALFAYARDAGFTAAAPAGVRPRPTTEDTP